MLRTCADADRRADEHEIGDALHVERQPQIAWRPVRAVVRAREQVLDDEIDAGIPTRTAVADCEPRTTVNAELEPALDRQAIPTIDGNGQCTRDVRAFSIESDAGGPARFVMAGTEPVEPLARAETRVDVVCDRRAIARLGRAEPRADGGVELEQR